MTTIQQTMALLLALASLSATAQQTDTPPTLEKMKGSYVIINSKVYEGQSSVSEVRGMTIAPTADDSLQLSNFYMKGGLDFKAGYNAATGNISIPAGTKVFGYADGQGSMVFLYNWDDREQTVTARPVVYRYRGQGQWQTTGTVVLLATTAGSTTATPYIFSQGSRIALANATTNNTTYDGDGVRFEESRPSYVEWGRDSITVYNLLQKDSYGYGCFLSFSYDEKAGTAYSAPALIGQATAIDYPYKALTGCDYDDQAHKPAAISHAGTDREGIIDASIDLQKGILSIAPMAVWPAKYDGNGWQLDLDRYYEVEEAVTVTFTPGNVSSITRPTTAAPVITTYYTLDGRPAAHPQKGTPVIKKIITAGKEVKTEKVLIK